MHLHDTATRRVAFAAAITALFAGLPHATDAQSWNPMQRGSESIEVVGHLPIGARLSVTDMDIEQEMDRPYAFVSRANIVGGGERGVDIVSLEDPEKAFDFMKRLASENSGRFKKVD